MPYASTSRAARAALTAALAAAVALAVLALGRDTPASAQDPGARVLKLTELERGSTFKHVRNTRSRSQRANLLGDLIVFTNPLADAAGSVVGRVHVECVTTTGSSNFLKSKLTCSGIMTLPGGTLTLQAMTSPGKPTTNGAITGGTGVYANARGVLVSTERRSGGSDDTITLVP